MFSPSGWLAHGRSLVQRVCRARGVLLPQQFCGRPTGWATSSSDRSTIPSTMRSMSTGLITGISLGGTVCSAHSARPTNLPHNAGFPTAMRSAWGLCFYSETVTNVMNLSAEKATRLSRPVPKFSYRVGIAAFGLLFVTVVISGFVGQGLGPRLIHPANLNPQRTLQTQRMLDRIGAAKEDFSVRVSDGVDLRGWKIRQAHPNGNWVLLASRRFGQSHRRPGPR